MELPHTQMEENNAALLDILFNLLIFFIMACEASVRENVRINNPKVVNVQSARINNPYVLNLNLLPPENDPDSSVIGIIRIKAVDKKLAQFEELKPDMIKTFKASLASGHQPEVILNAAGTFAWDQVHTVMGEVSEAFLEVAETNPNIDPIINLKVTKMAEGG